MAATKPRTSAEKLRNAADQLYMLAERYETPQRDLVALQRLHDDTETVAGDVRAIVRGLSFT